MDTLSLKYRMLVESDPLIKEALDVAVLNSVNGNVWLIGGAVYRVLNRHFHNKEIQGVLKEISDVDVLFENLRSDLITRDYELTHTSFGEPRLRKRDVQIDLIQLSNVTYIRKHSLEPTIENYLAGTFTDVQNIAFDLLNNQLIGSGILALRRKKIKINNPEELEYYCGMKGITIKEYLTKLSKSLDIPLF
jgi:hypothetical protein